MGVCTGISALQLGMVGASFLLAVLCLDMFWVKLPEELHNGDIAPTLKRQSLLNMFVAFGASAAAGQRVWSVAGSEHLLASCIQLGRFPQRQKRSPAGQPGF